MYQIELQDPTPNSFVYTNFWADVKDKITTPITYLSAVSQFLATPYFLIEYKSQLTGKIKRFNPFGALGRLGGVTHDDRYLWFLSKVSLTDSDDVANGLIKVGTTDMPYGMYDFKIYEMESAGDYDPDNALATLFSGLMNLSARGDYKQSVEYTQYNDNDSDTESVYITI